MQNCPTGFEDYEGTCVQDYEMIAQFTFDEILNVYTDNSHKESITIGGYPSLYPNLTTFDPIPAIARGLYFNSTSFMTTSNMTLSTSFTIVF